MSRACSTAPARSGAAGGTGAAPAPGIRCFPGDGRGQGGGSHGEGQGRSGLRVPSGPREIQFLFLAEGLHASFLKLLSHGEKKNKNNSCLDAFVGWLSAELCIPGKRGDDLTRNAWLYVASAASTCRLGWR